jgi:Cadherin-like
MNQFAGIAIEAYSPAPLEGAWQYQLNSGGPWQAVGAVSPNSALVLGASDLLRFVPNPAFSGPIASTLGVHLLDNSVAATPAAHLDVSSAGGSTSVSASLVQLTTSVINVNASPTMSNNTLGISEGEQVVLSSAQIQATDLDAPAANTLVFSVTSASHGMFSLLSAPLAPISQFTQNDVDTGNLLFTHDGTEAAPSYNLSVSDGMISSASQAAAISFQPVNDRPTVSVSATAASVNEDTSKLLGSMFSSLSVTDPDAGANLLQVSLSVNLGALSIDSTGRSLYASSSAASALSGMLTSDASGNVTFYASTTSVNNALGQFSYRPLSNANGTSFSMTLAVDDLGNSGAPAAQTGPVSITRNFTVNAVNDAPQINGVLNANGLEDTDLVFSTVQGNQLTILDPDGNVTVKVTIDVTNGVLDLASTSGLSFTAGDGRLDGQLAFTGKINAINTALDGLRFHPNQDVSGNAALAITVNDLGNIGRGGAKTASTNIAITLQAVNDAPIINAAQNFALDAGAATPLDSTRLLVTDIESGAANLIYTLDTPPAQGELLLHGFALGGGATFTQLDVNQGALSYQGNAGETGTDHLQLTVHDEGNLATAPIRLSIDLAPPANPAAAPTSAVVASPTVASDPVATNNTTSATSIPAPATTNSVSAGSNATGASSAPLSASLGLVTSNAPVLSNVTTQASKADTRSGNENLVGSGMIIAAPTGSATGVSSAGAAASSRGESAENLRNVSGSYGSSQGSANVSLANAQSPGLSLNKTDLSRLQDLGPSPLTLPLGTSVPVSDAVAQSNDLASKTLDIERNAFNSAGIFLPAQAISLEKVAAEADFQKTMERVREEVMQVASLDRNAMASTIGVSASFTIGYLVWLIRGGVLISSLLASLPAWRMVDPLPVLGKLGNRARDDNDDQSLADIVESHGQRELAKAERDAATVADQKRLERKHGKRLDHEAIPA